MKKKSEESLQREVKKGEKADKFIKQTYAKQMVQCNKNKERTLANKYKVQSLVYSLDGVFCNLINDIFREKTWVFCVFYSEYQNG